MNRFMNTTNWEPFSVKREWAPCMCWLYIRTRDILVWLKLLSSLMKILFLTHEWETNSTIWIHLKRVKILQDSSWYLTVWNSRRFLEALLFCLVLVYGCMNMYRGWTDREADIQSETYGSIHECIYHTKYQCKIIQHTLILKSVSVIIRK